MKCTFSNSYSDSSAFRAPATTPVDISLCTLANLSFKSIKSEDSGIVENLSSLIFELVTSKSEMITDSPPHQHSGDNTQRTESIDNSVDQSSHLASDLNSERRADNNPFIAEYILFLESTTPKLSNGNHDDFTKGLVNQNGNAEKSVLQPTCMPVVTDDMNKLLIQGLQSLQGDAWLESTIIDPYLKLLVKNGFYAFNRDAINFLRKRQYNIIRIHYLPTSFSFPLTLWPVNHSKKHWAWLLQTTTLSVSTVLIQSKNSTVPYFCLLSNYI